MDPDATLDELLAPTGQLLDPPDDDDNTAVPLDPADVRLAELLHALDGWLTLGGFLPRRWAPSRRSR